MTNHTCAIDGCRLNRWTQRGLNVCGHHARQILEAMQPEIEERAKLHALAMVHDLHEIIGDQQRRILELEATPARPERQATDGTIYYLRVGGYIKIGWTADLAKRMRSYSPDSVLLATEPGTRSTEQRRHKQFAAHRTHGREWYAIVPSLNHHIELLTAEHGAPDPVAFSAKPVGIPQPRHAKPVSVRGNARRV